LIDHFKEFDMETMLPHLIDHVKFRPFSTLAISHKRDSDFDIFVA